jgi:hypothetical protein
MDYREPPPVTRERFQQLLMQGNARQSAQALIGLVFSDPDWKWLQDLCLSLVEYVEPDVRAAAVTSLGHIARIHGRIERSLVEPRLRQLLDDPFLAGRAQDALDDIASFAMADG